MSVRKKLPQKENIIFYKTDILPKQRINADLMIGSQPQNKHRMRRSSDAIMHRFRPQIAGGKGKITYCDFASIFLEFRKIRNIGQMKYIFSGHFFYKPDLLGYLQRHTSCPLHGYHFIRSI